MAHQEIEQIKRIEPKIMIVDRDRIACQALEQAIVESGYNALVEPTKEKALQAHEESGYNIIFHDCSPQPEPRPFIIGLRRGSGRKKRYTYVVIASREKTRDNIIQSGGNDVLSKPIDPSLIKERIENGVRLLSYYHDLLASAEDNSIPCKGAMLGKSAITQVFLTAVDRADRYGEKAYLLEMRIENIEEIQTKLGEEKAQQAVRDFIEKIKRTRRQSDMIGQFDDYRFALIMQRTVSDREPIDATERLCQSIESFLREPDMIDYGLAIQMRTMGIPVGDIVATAFAKTRPADEEADKKESSSSIALSSS